MGVLVGIVGIFIGYILNNYILTVNEDEKGEVFKCNFDKNKTLIILLWNSLIPVLLFKMYGLSGDFFRFAILNALCSAVFFIDFRLHIIPNILNLIAFTLGCVCIFLDNVYASDYIVGGAVGLIFFLLIIVFSKLILKKDGMGLGDAKFMCVVGIMMGLINTVCIIFFSFIFGAIGASIALFSKKKEFGQEIAFGPYIVIATMIMMFFGGDILSWYFGLMV